MPTIHQRSVIKSPTADEAIEKPTLDGPNAGRRKSPVKDGLRLNLENRKRTHRPRKRSFWHRLTRQRRSRKITTKSRPRLPLVRTSKFYVQKGSIKLWPSGSGCLPC